MVQEVKVVFIFPIDIIRVRLPSWMDLKVLHQYKRLDLWTVSIVSLFLIYIDI